jgi:drug/metabolite transporter (DMT)-like permease
MSDRQSQTLLPVISLLIAATLWGVSWYPLRLLEHQGVNGLWTSVIIYSIPMIIGFVVFRHVLPQFWRHPWLVIIVALGNGWCNVAFIIAVLDGEVMRVLLLFYLSPLWATILGWLWLGENLSRISIATLMLALLGALVMLWDPNIGAPWPKQSADWLAISSGMAFAGANVTLRKLQDVSLQVKTVASWTGVTILASIWLLLANHSFPQATTETWLWLTLFGPLVVLAMTYSVFYGVTHLPVHKSAVILLFELVVGAISSQMLTDEIIGLNEWIGGGLIILAAYLSTRTLMYENRCL